MNPRYLVVAAWSIAVAAVIWFATVVAFYPVPAARAAGQQGPVYCNQADTYDAATIQTLRIRQAAGAGSAQIYICGIDMVAAAAQTVQLVTGTGTNCGTGQAVATPAFNLGAGGLKIGGDIWKGLLISNGLDLCIKTTVATSTQAVVYSTTQ